jgi:DnaJ-class molecular chaperone
MTNKNYKYVKCNRCKGAGITIDHSFGHLAHKLDSEFKTECPECNGYGRIKIYNE